MKILAVGDPHGSSDVFKIPVDEDIDAVFITGDLGKTDLVRKYYFKYIIGEKRPTYKDMLTNEQLLELYEEMIDSSVKIVEYFASKKPTFFLYGNIYQVKTDFMKEELKRTGIKIKLFEERVKGLKNLHYIGYKTSAIKGMKIAGIEYFQSMEWNTEFGEDTERNAAIAEKEEPPADRFIESLGKVDILLTHLPPKGILDEVSSEFVPKAWFGKHAGSTKILEYIKNKKPKIVLCGHIHEQKGMKKIGKTTVYNLGHSGEYRIIEI